MRGPQIEVELLFDKKTSAWAKDRTWHTSQQATVGKDGRLKLLMHVADTPELKGWILSLGQACASYARCLCTVRSWR